MTWLLKQEMQSVRKEANFILGPKSNSHPRRPKSASHHVHSVARQLFAEMPQRLPRAPCVVAMRELRPHLHAACTCAPALSLVDARGSPSSSCSLSHSRFSLADPLFSPARTAAAASCQPWPPAHHRRSPVTSPCSFLLAAPPSRRCGPAACWPQQAAAHPQAPCSHPLRPPCTWPGHLGLPPGHTRQPEGAHGPPCAAPPLLVAV